MNSIVGEGKGVDQRRPLRDADNSLCVSHRGENPLVEYISGQELLCLATSGARPCVDKELIGREWNVKRWWIYWEARCALDRFAAQSENGGV